MILQVLSLLHEALSQSGDHYSIEYDGRSGTGTIGSFRRQMIPCGSGTLSAPDDDGLSGQFKRQLPPPEAASSRNKRRRHSDSGSTRQDMLLLTLPNPRGNMKGSLSLEGDQSVPKQDMLGGGEASSSNSSSSPRNSPMSAPISPFLPSKASPCEALICNPSDDISLESVGYSGLGKASDWANSQDSECSSVFSDDTDQGRGTDIITDTNDRKTDISFLPKGSFSLARDLSICSVLSEGGESLRTMPDNKSSKRRRMWYKHHHFSTPVTDELNVNANNHTRVPVRSSSLPDPHTLPLAHPDIHLPPPHSPQLFSSLVPPSASLSPPIITVSSPSASDSQVTSDDVNTSVIGSSTQLDRDARTDADSFKGDDCDTLANSKRQRLIRRASLESLSLSTSEEVDKNGSSSLAEQVLELDDDKSKWANTVTVSALRPSVIRTAVTAGPGSDSSAQLESQLKSQLCATPRSSCLKTARRTGQDVLEVVSLDHTKHLQL